MPRPLVVLAFLSACRVQGPYVPQDTGVRIVYAQNAPGTSTRTCPTPDDRDGDGYDDAADGGTDCDDFGAGIHPGQADVAGDGLDADCDGLDGAPADPACVPVGPETCDGTDEDCDGQVDDALATRVDDTPEIVVTAPLLADGAAALVFGEPSTGAADGTVAVYDAAGTLVVRISGTGQGPTFGRSLAAGRDLTGDGAPDLVIAAPYATTDAGPNTGRVFVLPGPIGAATTLADAVFTFEGGELPGQPGTELALLPDVTGDGLPELVMSYYRFVLLFSGVASESGTARFADAVATWEVNTGGGAWAFATVPDEDGDALPELVLGMPTYASGAGLVGRWDSEDIGGTMGAADALYGDGATPGIGGALVTLGDALWTLAGTTVVRLDTGEALDVAATALADAGDVDADGTNDLLVATEDGVLLVTAAGPVGTWPGGATLAVGPAVDVSGDGVPDPAVIGATWTAALDGAVAFAAVCDADGDGTSAAAGDCDDDRADVLPVAGREICDGADHDCDGVVDGPAEAALPARAVWADGVGDLDLDGTAEFAAIDAAGLLTVLDGEGTPSVRATVSGGRTGIYRPFAGAGDTDGDTRVELLVSGEDAAWLLPIGESGDAADLATTRFVDGPVWAREDRVGSAGDLDGDGLDDVWIGVRSLTGSYGIAVLPGEFDAQEAVDDGLGVWMAPASWDTYEVAAAPVGGRNDLDGDGRDDLLIGNPRSAYGDGRVYVFNRPPAGDQDMDRAAVLLLYGETAEAMGTTLAAGGDLDGDGTDDALLGGAAGVQVLSGAACPLLAERYAVAADATALVDLDGDGISEAWLGDDDAGGGAGAISRVVAGALTTWRLGTPGEALGGALWAIGDTDETGGGDLLYRTATTTVRVGARCE